MVRQVVVAVRHADERIGPIAAVVRHDERRDARGIGLKRQRQHVEHQPDLLLVSLEHLRRGGALGKLHLESLRTLRADFDVAHGGQILVQLAAVGRAQIFLEAARVLHDKIEHALVVQARRACAAFDSPCPLGGEQTVEHRLAD